MYIDVLPMVYGDFGEIRARISIFNAPLTMVGLSVGMVLDQ